MKVLMINSVCGIRSTGRICTDLADVLRENHHSCRVAYGRERAPEKYADIAVRIGRDMDNKLHGLETLLFDGHGLGSRRATKRFIKWVREYDPDVIHLHNLHGYYLNLKILFEYLRECRKPIVWTLHDCWAFTGHCAYFTASGCDAWETERCASCRYKKTYPGTLLLGASERNYALKERLYADLPGLTVVTPSHWLAELAGRSLLRQHPIEVIHNGIDLSAFSPDARGDMIDKLGLTGKRIVLGVAALWNERKGFKDFVALSPLLSEEYRIVLVGLSEEQMGMLPDGIIGIARTNNVAELAELYAAAEFFFNPTYEDNFPTTNIEALACGTPVITYRTGGSPEALDASCGFVVEKGGVRAAADIILHRGGGRDRYRAACLARAARFDRQVMCREYLSVYRRLAREANEVKNGGTDE